MSYPSYWNAYAGPNTLLTEGFTGTNGDPWDVSEWTTGDGGDPASVVDIQSNRGRLKADNATGEHAAAVADNTSTAENVEVTATVYQESVATGNAWLYFCLRSSGEIQTDASGRPETAYYLRVDAKSNDNNAYLYRRVSDSESQLVGPVNMGHSNGNDYKVRFHVLNEDGDVRIRARTWDVGDSEPDSWDIDYLDTAGSKITSAGKFQLVARNYNTSNELDLRIDDLSVVDATVSSSPTVVAVGQATETDTAFPVTPVKPISVAVGQATETDTAFPVTPVKPITVAVGQATETDTAFPITPVKPITVVVGQATETDTALPVTPVKPITVVVGQATETDTAFPITPVKPITVAVGQATETDTAFPITPVKPVVVPLGIATETDTALPVTPVKPITVAVGQATETDTALPVTPVQASTVAVGQATETDIAFPITPVKPITVAVGQATETDIAFPITPVKPVVVPLGIATETDTALPVTLVKPISVAVGQATEIDVALAVTAIVDRPGSRYTEGALIAAQVGGDIGSPDSDLAASISAVDGAMTASYKE